MRLHTLKGQVICLYSGICEEEASNPQSLYLLQVNFTRKDGTKEPWILNAEGVDNGSGRYKYRDRQILLWGNFVTTIHDAGRYIQDAGDYDDDKAPVSIKTGYRNNCRFLNWVSAEEHPVLGEYYTKVVATMDIPASE